MRIEEEATLEQSFESAEGYACYAKTVEVRALAERSDSAVPPPAVDPVPSRQWAALQEKGWPGDAAALRTLGLIEALLLDRLHRSWKTEFLRSGAGSFEAMLRRCAESPPEDAPPPSLEEILQDHDLAARIAEEEEKARIEGTARLDGAMEEVEAQPLRVEVSLPLAPLKPVEFDPYGLEILAPGVTRPAYLHLVGHAGTELVLEDGRAIRNRNEGFVTTSCRPDQVRLSADGVPIPWEKCEEIEDGKPFLLEVPGLKAKIVNGQIALFGEGYLLMVIWS
jgi:hypothetical protein